MTYAALSLTTILNDKAHGIRKNEKTAISDLLRHELARYHQKDANVQLTTSH